MTTTCFPPGLVTPGLIQLLERFAPSQPGGDFACVLRDVAEGEPDAYERVWLVLDAYLRDTHGCECDAEDWEDPLHVEGLYEFHWDMPSQWERVIAFAREHADNQ